MARIHSLRPGVHAAKTYALFSDLSNMVRICVPDQPKPFLGTGNESGRSLTLRQIAEHSLSPPFLLPPAEWRGAQKEEGERRVFPLTQLKLRLQRHNDQN